MGMTVTPSFTEQELFELWTKNAELDTESMPLKHSQFLHRVFHRYYRRTYWPTGIKPEWRDMLSNSAAQRVWCLFCRYSDRQHGIESNHSGAYGGA